jgi:hypothetical protein
LGIWVDSHDAIAGKPCSYRSGSVNDPNPVGAKLARDEAGKVTTKHHQYFFEQK